MTTTIDMLDLVDAALAVDHGSGFDLSATGAVMRGAYDVPPMGQRFVCYYPAGSVTDEWMDLREPSYLQRVVIMGWEPAQSHDPAGRITAALGLQGVLLEALHGIWLGASPPSRVRDHRITAEPIDPAVMDIGLTSHGLIAIELAYKISGEGGRV